MAGIASVTKYWCSVGCSGRVSPASAATSRPQRPAAFTTQGVRMSPFGVRTIQVPSGCASVAVTGVKRWISAPRCRAPTA